MNAYLNFVLMTAVVAGITLVTMSAGGSCPAGISAGQYFTPAGTCQSCKCFKITGGLSYSCEQCPTTPYYYDSTKCYSYFNNTRPFKDCCQPIVKCRGQLGFNESMMTTSG